MSLPPRGSEKSYRTGLTPVPSPTSLRLSRKEDHYDSIRHYRIWSMHVSLRDIPFRLANAQLLKEPQSCFGCSCQRCVQRIPLQYFPFNTALVITPLMCQLQPLFPSKNCSSVPCIAEVETSLANPNNETWFLVQILENILLGVILITWTQKVSFPTPLFDARSLRTQTSV